jgi:hypothetical protein
MTTTSLRKVPEDMRLCKKKEKEIKDAYPKKVCHMLTRHVKKKKKERCIPKEGMPHALKACQKKERDSPCPTRKRKRESWSMSWFIHHSTKNIHTLAHLDQGL